MKTADDHVWILIARLRDAKSRHEVKHIVLASLVQLNVYVASLVHPENTIIIKTGNGFEADSNCDEHIENCHFHVHVGPKRRSSEIVASRVFSFYFVFFVFFCISGSIFRTVF